MARAPRTSRRRFLAASTAAATGATLPFGALAHAEPEPPAASLPARPFGKTGETVSLFGLGCFPLGALSTDEEGIAVVLRAIDAGCTYLDTAPSYSRGRSERRVGLALAERKDAKVWVATKTHTRTRDDAWRDIRTSLQRLAVERIDVLQIHAVSTAEDMQRALDTKSGPLAAAIEAREQKLVRYIGVTGHADPYVMRKTFETWDFDSILFPLNCVDPHYESSRAGEKLSFVDTTLPAAKKKGLARIAMKVFASGRLPAKGIDAAACLRFSYGLDISTAIVGCKSTREVDLAVRVARENQRLTSAEQKTLLEQTVPHRGRGTEWYKRA